MLRIICNILVSIFLTAILALLAVIGFPMLKGYQLYAVLTGSMEPTHPVGSIVVVENVEPDQIRENDVISFKMEGFETPVTHRVIRVDRENRLFYTKGDNNPEADFSPVAFQNLHGRIRYGIPQLGFLVSEIRSPKGILVTLWIVFAVIALLALPDLQAHLWARKLRFIQGGKPTDPGESLCHSPAGQGVPPPAPKADSLQKPLK